MNDILVIMMNSELAVYVNDVWALLKSLISSLDERNFGTRKLRSGPLEPYFETPWATRQDVQIECKRKIARMSKR